jgi:hypothetical protein
MVPKKQGKSYGSPANPQKACNVLNLSDKVKILGLLKGDMFLVEVRRHCGKNELSIFSTVLNSAI